MGFNQWWVLPEQTGQVIGPVFRQQNQEKAVDDHDCPSQFHAFENDPVEIDVQHFDSNETNEKSDKKKKIEIDVGVGDFGLVVCACGSIRHFLKTKFTFTHLQKLEWPAPDRDE